MTAVYVSALVAMGFNDQVAAAAAASATSVSDAVARGLPSVQALAPPSAQSAAASESRSDTSQDAPASASALLASVTTMTSGWSLLRSQTLAPLASAAPDTSTSASAATATLPFRPLVARVGTGLGSPGSWPMPGPHTIRPREPTATPAPPTSSRGLGARQRIAANGPMDLRVPFQAHNEASL
jgi:hypothetical protein